MTLLAAAVEAASEPERGIGWVYLVVVVVGFYAGRRVWWSIVGRDRARNLDARQTAEMYRRWGSRCAYRYSLLPFAGPFFCRGPLRRAHQVAHSKGGRSRPGNVFPLCQKHNARMKARSNAWWWLTRSIPLLGHLLIGRRWVTAEGWRRFRR